MGISKSKYENISSTSVKLDLVGLIGNVSSSTPSRLSAACPPRSALPPPCYVGIGMNSYIVDSENMPQWRGDAYLLTNHYRFNVENARMNAWLSMLPKSSPGKVCYVEVTDRPKHLVNWLSVLSYVFPFVSLLPGAIFGGVSEILLLVSLVAAGLSGTAYSYFREEPGWTGPDTDTTKMRLLVLIPGDKWYLIYGENRFMKKATAGSALRDSAITYALKWMFKISTIGIFLCASNACLMAQVGLLIAYILNTIVCEVMVHTKGANTTVIGGVTCRFTHCEEYESKQKMLDYIEENGKRGLTVNCKTRMDEPGWRQHFGLTVGTYHTAV